MSPDVMRWLLAALAAGTIAAIARQRRSLGRSGALAATVSGTVLVGAAGWWSGVLLVAFFLSSSILSRQGAGTTLHQARGAERDAVQVLANGGVAVLTALLFALSGAGGWLLALAGSIAAANADTWSTEIGRTSRSLPRLITTGRTVPAGTSGAVSGRGLAAALAGGAVIAALAAAGWHWGLLPGHVAPFPAAVAVTLGGFAGSLADSFLGATVQDGRWCDTCGKPTEQKIHRCGTVTRSVGGIRWIDNDIVNLSCAIAGAGATWAVVGLLT